jgi:hypothetical protein
LGDNGDRIYDNIGTVKEFKMIKDTLLIHSKNSDNTSSNIFVRNGDSVHNYKSTALGEINDFLVAENADFSDEDNPKMLYISETKLSRVTCKLINFPENSSSSKGHLDSDGDRFKVTTYEIIEMSDVMFRFPNLVVIKGGYEVIHVNVVNDHYSYFQLPG